MLISVYQQKTQGENVLIPHKTRLEVAAVKVTNNEKTSSAKTVCIERENAEDAFLKISISADEIPEETMDKVRNAFEKFWEATLEVVLEDMKKADPVTESQPTEKVLKYKNGRPYFDCK